ncbi:MAG: nucleotidyltransferase domain-containing protein [Bacteroidota bacterium]|nr:nucleotidyltransferase domain-containing protein [Flavisolibacter sp.]MBD0350447.1 nucleotidyltransferase domain-containing protein [Flavisolibacter sp.]MBD0376073.1 nucleotidyltransferase domain-containing protein [Flavisolibacter sp.]MDQ3845319.1 nucleotidyltransferase domain-containing protein [Bacteroidota bacterium]
MVDVVKDNLDKIIEACKQMQVKSLYLFGSGSRTNGFDQNKSDLDFIFQFVNGRDGLPVAGYDYFDLLFALEEITGKKVDLVAEERISNKYFLESINKDKIRIYEA